MEQPGTLSTPFFSPAYKIIESLVNLVYVPITLDVIDSLKISITDQDDHLLNLRNEKLTLGFILEKRDKKIMRI